MQARDAGGGTAPTVSGGVEHGGGCSPGAVVLSLFSSRADYYAGQYPQFDVYAVSTASRACSYDVSPGQLHVLVMSFTSVSVFPSLPPIVCLTAAHRSSRVRR